MSIKPQNAVCVNCNDPQIPSLEIMLQTLRDPERGNFDGDVWVLSTFLSEEVKSYLDFRGVNYFEDALIELNNWHGREKAAQYTLLELRNNQNIKNKGLLSRPDVLNGGDDGVAWGRLSELYFAGLGETLELESEGAFQMYKKKRMSKLIFINFSKKHQDRYENVIFCDTDVIFQSDVSILFHEIKDDRIYFNYEFALTTLGSTPSRKNIAYNTWVDNSTKLIEREINIGVLVGKQSALEGIWTEVKACMMDEAFNPLIDYNWHEQDYFRLLLSKDPQKFCALNEKFILNLFNSWTSYMTLVGPIKWRTNMGSIPIVLHFLGGCGAEDRVIKNYYNVKLEELLLSSQIISLKDKGLIAKRSDIYNTASWIDIWCLLEKDPYAVPDIKNIVEGGTFLGGGAYSIKSTDIGKGINIRVFDNIVAEYEWESILNGKGIDSMCFDMLRGKRQLEVIEFLLGEEDGVNLHLRESMTDGLGEEQIDFAILNRCSNMELFAQDFDACWKKLRPKGYIGVNQYNMLNSVQRVNLFKVLANYVDEIERILYFSIVGKLAIQHA